MTPDIVQYRPPQARIAVAYSSKDRVQQTRLTIARLIDDPRLDLYWFDGSATEAGRDLPLELCAGRTAVCAVHRGVVGGPDSAIMYALETLRPHAYDLVILIENDVVLQEGWYEAMHAAISRAEGAGFKVGAATVRVLAKRVLSFNDDYCLMLNSGAGFIALTPAAVDIVLAHYRTLDGAEFIRHFRSATGIDVTGTVEFELSQRLSVDWLFDLILYLHGYVSAAPPVTFATILNDAGYPDSVWVSAMGQHLPQVHSRLTRPEQIRQAAFPFFQFQKSPLSDRLLVGCHQLLVGVNSLDGHLAGAGERRLAANLVAGAWAVRAAGFRRDQRGRSRRHDRAVPITPARSARKCACRGWAGRRRWGSCWSRTPLPTSRWRPAAQVRI